MSPHLVGLDWYKQIYSPNTFKFPIVCGMDRWSNGWNGFFIRPATGTSSSDWIRIPNSDIKVRSARRITRTIVRGQEGDNLHDEGSESTLYTVSRNEDR